MKILISVVILTCLAFPVFAQNSDAERFRTLSETMDRSISRSADTLADFDTRATDDSNLRTFSYYRRKHTELVSALRESQLRLEQLFRTKDRAAYVKQERDNYERLLIELQSMKSDYDVWLRTIQ